MNNNPLISIVMPTYNQANYLAEAINSVIHQTYKNWELIIVDNFSNDETPNIVKTFSDKRIIYHKFRNQGIISASRNIAIKFSKGDLVAFLDSDDVWYPNKLMVCIKNFDDNTDLIGHGLSFFGIKKGNFFPGPIKKSSKKSLIRNGNCLTPSGTIVRKSLLNEVRGFSEDSSFITSEDYHLWIKLSGLGIRMKFIKAILGKYRTHKASNSISVVRHLNSVIAVVDNFYFDTFKMTLLNKIMLSRRYSIATYGAGRTLSSHKKYLQSLPFYFKSIVQCPFFIRPYLMILISLALTIRHMCKKL